MVRSNGRVFTQPRIMAVIDIVMRDEMIAVSPVIAYLQADEKEALRDLAYARSTSISKILRALVQAEIAVAGKKTAKGTRSTGRRAA